jgi:hypothetical protein
VELTGKELLKENGITKESDPFAFSVFDYWYSPEIENDRRKFNCWKFKISEYVFCKESKSLALPFTAEMNWGDKYGADIFLRNGKYGFVAADYKVTETAFHIAQKNKWNITAHNWTSLKLNQVERYCEEGLRYIIIDRRIDANAPQNLKAQSFLKAFHWHEESFDLETKRTIIIVDLKRLCTLIGDNEEIIHQRVPEHERDYEINGYNWNGKTVCFNYNIWPCVELTHPKEKKDNF